MRREYYKDSIANFRATSPNEILGNLVRSSGFAIEQTQRDAWLEEISILQQVLSNRNGQVYFEYAIPRMGKRIDVVLVTGSVIFVLEFKVGESEFKSSALDQVCDYALDLKNFHESSRDHIIAPVLIATGARRVNPIVCITAQNDKLLYPIRRNVDRLGKMIDEVLSFAAVDAEIDAEEWERGRYCPTPTIIEAALALYKGHSVSDISRNDATAINLSLTSEAIADIISASKKGAFKSICFVTGVPGAGKTLVGLNTATKHHEKTDGLYSVFLSGNAPLVAILREALALDNVQNEKEHGRKVRKGEARSKVRAFVQNVHHFRGECLIDPKRPPIEHVALFGPTSVPVKPFPRLRACPLPFSSIPRWPPTSLRFLLLCVLPSEAAAQASGHSAEDSAFVPRWFDSLPPFLFHLQLPFVIIATKTPRHKGARSQQHMHQ